MSRRLPLELRLQTPRGELAGVVKTLERYRMIFELAAPMRPGDAADFQVLLRRDKLDQPPLWIHGMVRVLRLIDADPDAPTLFSGEMVTIRQSDIPAFESWLSNHANNHGRSFSASSGDRDAPSTIDSFGSDGQATNLIDPLDRPDAQQPVLHNGRPYAFSASTDSAPLLLAGRESIRSALRHGLQARKRDAATRPGQPAGRGTWLARSRERAQNQARAWLLDDGTDPLAPPIQDPMIELNPDTDPVQVHVRWRDTAGFREDFDRHLRGGGIFLPTTLALPRQSCLDVDLHLPSGADLRCAGTVVATMPTGLGVSLNLSQADIDRLKQAD